MGKYTAPEERMSIRTALSLVPAHSSPVVPLSVVKLIAYQPPGNVMAGGTDLTGLTRLSASVVDVSES